MKYGNTFFIDRNFNEEDFKQSINSCSFFQRRKLPDSLIESILPALINCKDVYADEELPKVALEMEEILYDLDIKYHDIRECNHVNYISQKELRAIEIFNKIAKR